MFPPVSLSDYLCVCVRVQYLYNVHRHLHMLACMRACMNVRTFRYVMYLYGLRMYIIFLHIGDKM